MSDVQSATSSGYTRGLGNKVRGFNLQFRCLHRKRRADVLKVHFPLRGVCAAYKFYAMFIFVVQHLGVGEVKTQLEQRDAPLNAQYGQNDKHVLISSIRHN